MFSILMQVIKTADKLANVLTIGGASAESQKTSSNGDRGQNGDKGEMAMFDIELL